ncbi:conserved hypothetical protein [Talaromyces stipitatus ATCC 10500]|uniref:Heme-binding peroxidase n=1 Tax=Talaromyces stipitatus (strain ATCC 10500 / CBS 375.48 / QM 6759 / NRRL 1006) TaxID=441959 RepID=B8LXZ6_TALSN|nr:uncharacterized protein TSTA_062980 [Talaromyces stipitatus ATCC 10500]EED22811.1 conserved hypothetical protein [Talaromyces stipitatus ATCC 10500]
MSFSFSSSQDESHSTLHSGNVVSNTANANDSPQSDRNDVDLATRIHAASRAIHHKLHHGVVGRLLLAIPPNTNSPHLYALGISRFARIYSVFETAWREYLSTSSHSSSAELSTNDQARYHALLSQAYISTLARSQRLTSDLTNLKTEWGDNITTAQEGNDVAVRDTVTHVTQTCLKKPYVLLAYSWIMYMALFNGGRWIRDQLINAGPQFWFQQNENIDKADALIGPSFLSFWFFDDAEDGEDVKRAFKAAFVEASRKYLTQDECADVIRETNAMFQHCLNIVSEIDLVVALEREKKDEELRNTNFRGLKAFDRHVLLTVIILGVSLAMAVSYNGRFMTCLGY